MKKVAVFPGSFDPITRGHEEIVRRAAHLFDEIIVAVGRNTSKSAFFPEERRFSWVKTTFSNVSNVYVEMFDGLTVDFCRDKGAQFILRGVRSGADFEYERAIAHMNKSMHPSIETMVMFAQPELISMSSTIVREIIKNKGDVSLFLPTGVNVYV